MKTCALCDEPLVGKQTRFCSAKCRDTYWTKARKRGDHPVQYSPEEDIQSFLNDFFKLLMLYKDAIDRIAGIGKIDGEKPFEKTD